MKESFLSRFTPSLLSHETLEAIFVKRKELAKKLVEGIRESALTRNKHYYLLIGPRGIGKTHIVSVVYHRVCKDAAARDKLLIAWLREEEWGIASFLDFLLALLRTLVVEQERDEFADRYNALFELRPEEAELEAEKLLRDAVGDKTLLVITENLDEIFKGLEEKGQGKLRAYIQNNPFFVIVATSQSLFNGVSVRTSPFYGFFETHHLQEFSFEDVVSMLRSIASHEGDAELVSLIGTPKGRARIRAVHHLAAGNPRVYVILAQFLTCESLDQLVPPLMQTLDDLTPYYQARMNYLSPQQRKIVEFLCERRHAVSVGEIARRNFLTHQTTSGQLKKLRELGYAQAHQSGRESYYELREPLMRISMEVKKLRGEPIRLLVQFLQLWYSRVELTKRLESLEPQAECERQYLVQALKAREQESADPRVAACLRDYAKHEKAGDFEKALGIADELIETRNYVSDWFSKAECLQELGCDGDAERVKKTALQLKPTDANGWIDRVDVLIRLKQHEEALESCDKGLELDPKNAELWQCRVFALGFLERYDESLASCDKAIELNPDDVWVWLHRALPLEALGRHEEALASYDKALELAPKVAALWVKHAVALRRLERHEESLASFDKALEVDPKDAEVWLSRAFPLERLGRLEEALASYDEALEIDQKYALAWRQRAGVLGRLERHEEMLDSWGKALELGPKDADGWVSRSVMMSRVGQLEEALASLDRVVQLRPQDPDAWSNRGVTLSVLGRQEESLASLDKALELYSAEPDAVGGCFQERSSRAVVLMLRERWDEGREALDDALGRIANTDGDAQLEAGIVRDMLIRTADVSTWRRHIAVWIELFKKNDLLAALGQGIVQSISKISTPWTTNDAARAWSEVWQVLGSAHKELALPLRLLNTAVEYFAKPDKRVLLKLPVEERKVLEPLLGVPESDQTT